MDIDTWTANNDDPQWVQRHRHEIEEATGKLPPRRLPELSSWMDDHKGAVTAKLKPDGETTDDTTTEDDTNE